MAEDKIIDRLGALPFFSGLSTVQLGTVSEHINWLNLEPNTTVFKESDKGDAIYFILEGSFEVVIESGNGKSIQLATLTEGHSFGEMSLIDNLPRSATIMANTKSDVLQLKKNDFDELLKKHPPIGVILLMELTDFLCQHVREANESQLKEPPMAFE